jgi:signal transduction histidine kinase
MPSSIRACLALLFISCNCLAQPQPNVDSLLRVLKSSRDDTGKVIVYRMLTGLVKNTDPEVAIRYGKAGVELGKTLNFDKGVAGCYLNLAASFSDAMHIDSALTYIDSAITWSIKAGDPNRLALAYLNRADFNMQVRSLKKSLNDCDTALVYAEKANNNDRRARIYQTIGSVYFLQGIYKESNDYYNRAVKLYREYGNGRMEAIALNNIGNIYKRTGNYPQAISSFKHCIQIADSLDDRVSLNLYYTNLCDAYMETGDYANAEKVVADAFSVAKELNNPMRLAMAYTQYGQLNLHRKNYDASIQNASKGWELSKQERDIEWQHTAASILADAYAARGDHKMAFNYLTISKNLNDSMSRLKYDEDIAAIQTGFKLNEKTNEVLLLNAEKQRREQQINRQRLLLAAAAFLSFIFILVIFLLIHHSRLRQRMKELQIRNQIAADLHDEVGSSLSSIHMLSKMAEKKQISSEAQVEILSRMSLHARETMDKMGDIVWMIKPGESDAASLKERMEQFAYELCSSSNVQTEINLEDIEKIKLSMHKRRNIYLVFKEALNNAIKYSGTGKISVSALVAGRQLVLHIKDHGTGFDTQNAKRGNGLRNMQARAREMNGSLKITSLAGVGTTIELAVPT